MSATHSVIFASLVLFAGSLHAECPAQACYILTLRVDSCQARTEQFIGPANVTVPSGLILVPKNVEAKVVECAHPYSDTKSSLTVDALIQNERAFFYSWAGHYGAPRCDLFADKTVKVFVPNMCGNSRTSYAHFVPARLVESNPQDMHIACGDDGAQRAEKHDRLAAQNGSGEPCG